MAKPEIALGLHSGRYAWFKDYRVVLLAVVCAGVGFLVAALIFGKPWHLPPAWGDIPTWLATVAATAAGIVAYRVYRIEARRDQVSDEERRGAQAAKIGAWYGSRPQVVTKRMANSVQTYTSPEPVWGAFLRNASDLPVFDVTVKFYFPASGVDGSAETWNMHTIKKGVLPPNETPVHLTIDDVALRAYSDDPRMDAFHRVEIEFTDTQGFRWHRDAQGRLRDITNRAPVS